MKKIFLTGASSGIGKTIAIALTDGEHEVWGTSRDISHLPNISRFHPVPLDLADPLSIHTAFHSALAEAGCFDAVINNAGSGHFGPAENLSAATISDQFQVLVFGHIQLMQLALAAMHVQEHGLIINVTSLAARLPVPFMAAYNAAKAAMAAFTMSTQLELGESNVRIVDLQPGDICTEFNEAVTRNEAPDARYGVRAVKTWSVVERNMAAAPKPDLVARHVLRLIDNDNPPPLVTVGDLFQSKIAPLIFRLLPQRVQIWGLRKYYGI